MFITNLIKVGRLPDDVLRTVHPLLAYAVVGFGAAAYSPAKYGILTELLPPEKLVVANGWIEGLTVASIILGTVLGGALVSPQLAATLLAFDMPLIDTGIDTPAEAAIAVIARDLPARRAVQPAHPRHRRPLSAPGTQSRAS